MSSQRRGLYWEDFEIGQTLVTPARTITSTDIVKLQRKFRKQDGTVVQEMEITLMYRRRA